MMKLLHHIKDMKKHVVCFIGSIDFDQYCQ